MLSLFEQGLPVSLPTGRTCRDKRREAQPRTNYSRTYLCIKCSMKYRCTRLSEAEMNGIGTVPMTFIRAPYIESTGAGVEILSVVDGRIVAAREKNVLVTAFHPEFTSDNRVHRYLSYPVEE